jgi:hypothetical protein
MAVAPQTESRAVDRVLAHTRDHILSNISQTAFNHKPIAAIFFGQLLGAFGGVPMRGEGKKTQTGGESVNVRVGLGKGNAKRMSGAWDTHPTAPTDTVRFARANWKHYSSNITVSDTDLLINTGAEAISSLVGFESELAVTSLADLVADDAYENGSVASAITDLNTLVSANDVAQGLDGGTYEHWNARGLQARGTAATGVSFEPGTTSFATAGLANMRTCYLNASEGAIQPNCILTTYDIFNYYEGSLTPTQRFTNTDAADGAFTNLSYKKRPILPDDGCPSGSMFMLRIGDDGIEFCCLNGADFNAKDFKYAQDQEARVSEVQLKGNIICHNRKYSNKLDGITA